MDRRNSGYQRCFLAPVLSRGRVKVGPETVPTIAQDGGSDMSDGLGTLGTLARYYAHRFHVSRDSLFVASAGQPAGR